ncbi:MAG: MucR family transcriptional regulator, partial [Pseudomonadota bacterium]
MSTDTNENISKLDLLSQAADIVAAYVSNNAISASDLPSLLTTVHQKLGELAVEGGEEE